MPIEPDTKDWTWVIDLPCPECGFTASQVERRSVARLIRDNVDDWLQVLARQGIAVRPNESTWSPLEYACHVRDVFVVYHGRLVLMRTEESPRYPNWDQDRAAVEGDYAAQLPSVVHADLAAAGAALADEFEGLAASEWERRGERSDGAVFTIDTFARYLLHDLVHHIHDVGPDPL